MSDVIQLLPDSVANQIAAGEVIQRPASVIKELIENAVDAGATHIDVSVVDSGRTSIQVIDDGKGMSETDARLAFERHATSKITKAEDLFALHTMGFRGEALPSIAAVAQVELKTRQQGEDLGTDLSIAASKVITQEPCACPVGANFIVENLFYNMPARRKFLKSNATELNNIIAAFERIVLVYPNINFTFRSNGSEMYNLRACGLRQRIIDVFGRRINQDILPIKVETTVCNIKGFVGKPESAKKKNLKQFFFVNGRFMRHPYFHKAIQSVYERLIPQGEQVPYFIYFDVAPNDIDVNIHPTKTEIKFENEQAIFQILIAAVRDAVGAFSNVSTIEFDVEGKPNIPVFGSNSQIEIGGMPKVNYDPRYNPFNVNKPHNIASQDAQLNDLLSYNRRNTDNSISDSQFISVDSAQQKNIIEEKSPAHYQYKGKYIMTAVKSGLMIIDQHRAHVRVLFEEYQHRISAQKMHSQKILFPLTVEFTTREMVTLSQIRDDIKMMGFELVPLGGNNYSVNAIPEGFEGINIDAMLHDILNEVQEETASLSSATTMSVSKVRSNIALSLARSAAIPYGQVLNNDEMENVINSLFQCSNVNYTPDGHSILCIIKQKDIEAMLG